MVAQIVAGRDRRQLDGRNARQAIEEGRIRWRRRQLAAMVRDDPEEAGRVLSELDYEVKPPPLVPVALDWIDYDAGEAGPWRGCFLASTSGPASGLPAEQTLLANSIRLAPAALGTRRWGHATGGIGRSDLV